MAVLTVLSMSFSLSHCLFLFCFYCGRKSFYPALPASYYESILNATPWERAWLVGPPVCLKGATARRLSRAFPGKMVLVHSPTPPKMDPRRGPQLRQTGAAAEVGPWQEWEPTFGVIADVLFMRAAPGVLILGLGSFSFWAGWLNDQPNTQVCSSKSLDNAQFMKKCHRNNQMHLWFMRPKLVVSCAPNRFTFH